MNVRVCVYLLCNAFCTTEEKKVNRDVKDTPSPKPPTVGGMPTSDSMHLHVEFMDDVAYYHDEDGPG